MADFDRRISPSVEAQPRWEAQAFGGDDRRVPDQYYMLRAPSRIFAQAANRMRDCFYGPVRSAECYALRCWDGNLHGLLDERLLHRLSRNPSFPTRVRGHPSWGRGVPEPGTEIAMKLVSNEEKYWEFVRELRLDRDNTSGFVDQVKITPEQQRSYMAKHGSCYHICLERESPVGWVGVVDDDIRVAVHPAHKGKGIGRFMINELMMLYPHAKAKVLLANEASRNLFLSCGFVEYTRDEEFIYFKK